MGKTNSDTKYRIKARYTLPVYTGRKYGHTARIYRVRPVANLVWARAMPGVIAMQKIANMTSL